MTKFVATKRKGAVLRSQHSLTWLKSTRALMKLKLRAHLIDTILLEMCKAAFDAPDAVLVEDVKLANPEETPKQFSRGQVFHSRRVRFTRDGFEVYIGISFTVCVLLDIAFLDRPARASQSKFWCSAIISGDAVDGNPGEDPLFAEICGRIDAFAPEILAASLPTYREALNEIDPEVGEITPTGDMLSNVVFQVEDDRFHEQLSEIEARRTTLAGMSDNSALGLLNRLYSGKAAKRYLHAGRGASAEPPAGAGFKLDTILHSDRLRARAFVIETKQVDGSRTDLRQCGVTSSSEPVEIPEPERMNDRAYALAHSPANVLSAQLAAEIGEQF